MGEYAEMMLDGTCCAGCGEYMGGESAGFPVYCSSDCEPDNYHNSVAMTQDGQPRPSKTNCPQCGKLVKKVGLDMHIRDVHGTNQEGS